MATKMRRGRPTLPREKARSKRVVTFVTETEMNELHRLALAQQRSLSAVCHKFIRAALADSAVADDGSSKLTEAE